MFGVGRFWGRWVSGVGGATLLCGCREVLLVRLLLVG